MTAPQPPFIPTEITSLPQTPTPATEAPVPPPQTPNPVFGAPVSPSPAPSPVFGPAASPSPAPSPVFGPAVSPPQMPSPVFGAAVSPSPLSVPVVESAPLFARRGSVAVKLASIVVVALAAIVGGVVLSRDEPRRAKIGDCLAGQAASEIEIVKCGDPKALYRVVGKIDSITQADWDSRENACSEYPTAESSFWEGKKGAMGYALCLETVAQ